MEKHSIIRGPSMDWMVEQTDPRNQYEAEAQSGQGGPMCCCGRGWSLSLSLSLFRAAVQAPLVACEGCVRQKISRTRWHAGGVTLLVLYFPLYSTVMVVTQRGQSVSRARSGVPAQVPCWPERKESCRERNSVPDVSRCYLAWPGTRARLGGDVSERACGKYIRQRWW